MRTKSLGIFVCLISLATAICTISCTSVDDTNGSDTPTTNQNDTTDTPTNTPATDDTITQPSPGRPLAASDDNTEVITTVTETAMRMLADDEDEEDIYDSLLDELLDQPTVADATIDDSSGFIIARFENGETQSFEVVGTDSTDGLEEFEDDKTTASPIHKNHRISKPATKQIPGLTNIPGFDAFAGMENFRSHRIPAKPHALLANALNHFHPNWPSKNATNVIAKMLESRGYTVTQQPLTLQHLRELDKYGVILIETHGLWRDDSTFMDLAYCQDAITAENSVPNCGGNDSLNALLTTTTTTDEPITTHKDDLNTGRLYLHNRITTRQVNGSTEEITTQYYAATTHYVRQYCTGQWSDEAIFILNACRGVRQSDGLSPWSQLVADKTNDGIFLGWDKKLNYVYAAKAALNLFQLMTLSDEEVTINGITLLERHSPPIGMLEGLNVAYTALEDEGLLTSKRGANLVRRTDSTQGFDYNLMPYIRRWEAPDYSYDPNSRESSIFIWSEPETKVTIGTNQVDATPVMLCCTDQWSSQDLPTLTGNIRAEWKDRVSVPRTIHQWKPQFTVQGSDGAMQFSVQVHLQGRASMNGWSYRDTISDDAPPAQFDLRWEPKASAYSWQVSGQTVSGDVEYKYEGSGNQTFTEDDWGSMETAEDGKSVDITAYVTISYNVTETNHKEGSTTTYEDYAGISIVRNGITLNDNWTVAADTYTEDVGPGLATVSWSQFPADPPFQPDSTPR